MQIVDEIDLELQAKLKNILSTQIIKTQNSKNSEI